MCGDMEGHPHALASLALRSFFGQFFAASGGPGDSSNDHFRWFSDRKTQLFFGKRDAGRKLASRDFHFAAFRKFGDRYMTVTWPLRPLWPAKLEALASGGLSF